MGYFQAASQAAAALLGLLFVVIALRPGRIVGTHANPVAIFAFALALTRAWQLLESGAVTAADEGQPAGTSGSGPEGVS
jgi:hypothetical protein